MHSKLLGVILIIIGLFLISIPEINLMASDKIMDIGPIKISPEKNYPIQWPPIVGVVLLVGGIMIVIPKKHIHE
jgi:uncharacterized membrane protein HdeD (DUF308 family)